MQMPKRSPYDPVTAEDLVGVAIALVLALVPAFLVVVFPDNRCVHVALGDGRILLFWGITFGAIAVFRERFDRAVIAIINRYRKS